MHRATPHRTRLRRAVLAAAVVTTLVATGAAQAAAAPANPAGGTAPFQVLDPQAWQNPDT